MAKEQNGVKLEGGRAEFQARTKAGLTQMLETAFDMCEWEFPVMVKMYSAGDTLDYKALLMGYWFPAMAKQFTERGRATTADEMHDLMCHQFFGYTPQRKIGKTIIEPALITLTYPTEKTRGELYDFCRKVEEWCTSVGVQLPAKPNSKYDQQKIKENS